MFTRFAVLIVALSCVLSLMSCKSAHRRLEELHSAPQPNSSQQTPKPDDSVQAQITQIAALAKGRVGVFAMVLETGETLASLNPKDHFPMQSVYKLAISMAVMKQVDEGKLS